MTTNYNQLAQSRRMTITNPGSKRAYTTTTPFARNWVSANNQDRAKAINDFRNRQNTKWASMSYTNKDGTNKYLNGISTGDQVPTNVFDFAAGLTPTYQKTYKPQYIVGDNFTVIGTAVGRYEWIVWNSYSQLVEIEADLTCMVAADAERKLTLRIYVNDLPLETDAASTNLNNKATHFYNDFQGNEGTTCYNSVKFITRVDAGDTIKFLAAHTDANDTGSVAFKIFTANLKVKTLPMS